jgi:hypothetical protein
VLSDGETYYYLLDERGGPPLTLTVTRQLPQDTVRIHY